MGEEQTSLVQNFASFIQVIDNYRTADGSQLDYRIAVTTTGRDLSYVTVLPGNISIPITEDGDNGAFRRTGSMPRPWIERADGNVTGTFAQLAQVGTQGASTEMQLLAAEWALSERVADGTNDGFLRDDALLAVTIITDEDDCSREDNNWNESAFEGPCVPTNPNIRQVPSFVDFFDDLKGARGRWALAAIAIPPGAGQCGGDSSYEGDRIYELAQLAGDNAVFSNICGGNLAGALQAAVSTFTEGCDTFPPIE
jgi:hypothetical protein